MRKEGEEGEERENWPEQIKTEISTENKYDRDRVGKDYFLSDLVFSLEGIVGVTRDSL